jgi:hypothetical protein
VKRRPKVCKVHASVNPGACTACVLTAYYERQLAIKDAEIAMLQGTVDSLRAELDQALERGDS